MFFVVAAWLVEQKRIYWYIDSCCCADMLCVCVALVSLNSAPNGNIPHQKSHLFLDFAFKCSACGCCCSLKVRNRDKVKSLRHSHTVFRSLEHSNSDKSSSFWTFWTEALLSAQPGAQQEGWRPSIQVHEGRTKRRMAAANLWLDRAGQPLSLATSLRHLIQCNLSTLQSPKLQVESKVSHLYWNC